MASPEHKSPEEWENGCTYRTGNSSRLLTGLPNETLTMMSSIVEQHDVNLVDLVRTSIHLFSTWRSAERNGARAIAFPDGDRIHLPLRELPPDDLPGLTTAKRIDVALPEADVNLLTDLVTEEDRTIRNIVARGTALYIDILRARREHAGAEPDIVMEYPDPLPNERIRLYFDTTLL